MKALYTGIVLLLFASTATAADDVQSKRWYVGIGGGQSSVHGACSFGESLSPPAICDDESVAAKALLGYNVLKYAWLQFSYIDAGEAKLTQQASNATLEINPRLYNLFLDFDVPLGFDGRLSLSGKLGMTYYDTQYIGTGTLQGSRANDDGVSGAVGAGLGWRGWERVSVRADWEHFNDVSVNNGDVDLATISVLFHF